MPDTPTIRTGIYKHHKRGDRYQMLGVARHSETDELFVVYQALYGEQRMWVRPYGMFIQWVWHEGETVPRFKYVSSA